VNRLRGIGILNSRVLVGAVFTTAFAGLAYVWPEIFWGVVLRYMGGTFVFLSVYGLGPSGVSQDAMKGVAGQAQSLKRCPIRLCARSEFPKHVRAFGLPQSGRCRPPAN
jgi:hypothetical protein